MNEHWMDRYSGKWGRPMVANLVKAGHPLTVYNRTNHKEDAMSRKTLVTVGFLSMLAATLALSASDSLAADAKGKQGKQGKEEMAASDSEKKTAGQERVDVVEQPPEQGVQSDSVTPGKGERKDVVEDIGSKGDEYPSTGGGTRKDVIENINE